jgi:hypothetical protein
MVRLFADTIFASGPEVPRALDAVRNGTGKVELRTRVESNETELVGEGGVSGLLVSRGETSLDFPTRDVLR